MNRWNRTFTLACLGLLSIGDAPAFAEDAVVQSNTRKVVSIDDVAAPSGPEVGLAADRGAGPALPAKPAHEVEPPPVQESLPLGPVGEPLTSGVKRADHTTSNYWLQTVTALSIVIALIFALRWVMRRLGGPAATIGGGGLVEVLARTPIGHKTHVLFLRVNQRVIVAAQTPTGVNTLAEFDEPHDVAEVLQHVSAGRPQSISRSFARILGQHTGSGELGIADEGGDDDEHQVDRTRSRMSGLIGKMRSLRGDDPP